jgi:uncharacterized protein (TIGR02001 family)
MRFSTLSLGALMLAATATPAFADDTAPPPAITVSGGATVVSDYRFRGVSQTDKNFALQGTFTVAHESGLYFSVWGSSVDSYVIASGVSHQEIDLIGGYKKTFGGTTLDLGVLYYFYPKTKVIPGDHASSDFFEPYVSVAHTLGPVTAKATVNYAPKQKALALDQGFSGTLPKHDNLYVAGDLSAAIPRTPISLTAHLGHTFGAGWLAVDYTGKKGYTDWALGASVTYKVLTLGVSYVDTDADWRNPINLNKISKGGVVASLGVAF